MLTKLGQQMLTKIDRQLFHTIATDGRLAGAKQRMSLTYTIAFCHAWPILLFGFHPVLYPLLTSIVFDTVHHVSRSMLADPVSLKAN